MADDFRYDVFLSHSARDRPVVRALAERLRDDGLRVWFDEWELKPESHKATREKQIEEGLEYSRALVLGMSANAFGSEWAQLETGTFRFRDPLNKERRFIPLRLDNAPIRGSLAQFLYIDWQAEDRERPVGNRTYAKLLEACRPEAEAETAAAERVIQLDYEDAGIWDYAFSSDGKRILTGAKDNTARLWDLETGHCLRVFKGHTNEVVSVAWNADVGRALSGSDNGSVRLWDLESGRCLRVLEGHTRSVWSLAWSASGHRALSSSGDETVRMWDLESGRCLRVLEGHAGEVISTAWSADGRRALSGSVDGTVRLWDLESGRCLRVLEGHTDDVDCVAWSPDGRRALSGSDDGTVRLWDLETGRCLRVLEGHTNWVWDLAWSSDGRRALSGSWDDTVRLWDLETGRCLRVLKGHTDCVHGVAWSGDGRRAFSGDDGGSIRVWDLSEIVGEAVLPPDADQVQYTNAKVLLVGDTSAGKTGLSMRLALDRWEPSDSTVGAWATQWKLSGSATGAADEGVEREIWLWDFGGQADQRLIHQLYMDETALAVLVFDGQKEDLFESLGQWDRALARAASQDLVKLLVAGRVDAGGLRDASRAQVKAFAKDRGYLKFLETSAKQDTCCEDLRQAILEGIRWEHIPWRSSPLLFKRLKREIVRLKDEGRVLMRFNELRDALQLRLLSGNGDGVTRFSDEELKAAVGLLAGPAVVWELEFGSWVLLQPERINAYAQAVIATMRADERDIGCLPEERVLNGDLVYQSSMERLEDEEERFVLLAMHQTLVERGLCLREHTDEGTLLIFPSFYRRERPKLVDHPSVLVSYRFSGFLDDIYATLVVKLHHTRTFDQDQLWRYAADFKTPTGKQMGVKLTRRAEGAGELEVYFDPAIAVEEKIIFSRYIHEHLQRKAKSVVRLRHYVCPHCGTPVGNREVAMKKLEEGRKDIPCVECDAPDKRIPLWDLLEELFASPETKQRVRELEEQLAIVLDSESKERILVGEVISTVALTGQLCREFAVSDHGIDVEIEFKDDAGQATGQRLYLQLKSGDSYLYTRKRDGAEIFRLPKQRHARYWMAQAYPVFLVIRTSNGEIRWMEVRDWLRERTDGGKKQVRQIEFEGERFDVMSVRRWRERALRRG